MKAILSLLVFVSSTMIWAQDFYYKDYDWSESPETYELSEEENAMDEVVLKKKQTLHLVIIDDQPYEYRLLHEIIKLNTDDGIEKYNTWYLSNRNAVRVDLQKARVITPDGKVVIQDSEDIKEALDENGEVEYKYFAFEGIEKGSTIEFLELVLYPARLTGSTFTLQGSELKKNLELEIITPDFLVYQTHPINNAPDFELDTTVTEERRLFIDIKDVKPLKEEDWSTYGANLQKVYYKFNANLNSSKANFYNYSSVTSNIYESIFAQPSSKQLKGVQKYLKSLHLDDLSTEEKIRTIENDIKKNFYIIEQSFENSKDLTFILDKHIMNDDGFYVLMINCLRQLNIECELVVTCDRYSNRFLTDYEAYNFLEEFILYLPKENKYLSYHLFNRYGFIPYEFTSQKGLFIREKKIGDILIGVGQIKDISTPTAEQSIDELIVKVEVDASSTETQVEITRNSTGYKAQPYQIPLDYLVEDQIKELKEEYLSYIDNEATIEDMTFENASTLDFGKGAFSGTGKFTSNNFIEKGGDKILLKAGLFIGPQSELYNREARISSVESPYPRVYRRIITIKIPEGMKIKNPEDLTTSIKPLGDNGSIGFVSWFEIKVDVIEIHVEEWYNEVHYEADQYPQYEEVINAAADFNKVVLILEPK